MSSRAIRFPLFHTPEVSVEFFPDELPDDHYDLIDCLRFELAPLKIWKTCALEYYKQGSITGFDAVLQDIVNELKNPEVMAAYKARDDYAEGISEIYILLAAKEILNLATTKVVSVPADQVAGIVRRCLDNLKMAEAEKLLNEYTWVLKGFFEFLQDNKKRAEELFKMVLERVTKGQAAKRKFLFVALIGLGMVAFSQNNYPSAMDYFSRAVTTFPGCHASVRTAISCCSFKLQQYDRARLALHRANEIDAGDVNQLVLQSLLELAEAKKDRANRVQLRQQAYEYLYLANKMDPNHPSTLVLLANHDFHSWRTIVLEPKGFAVAMDKILVPHKGYNEVFEVGNQIKLKVSDFVGNHRDNDEKESQHLIVDRKEITNLEEYENQLGFQLSDLNGNSGHKYFEISLNPPLKFPNFSMTFPHSLKNVEVKNLKSVVELATKAMYCTNINAIKAECYYILGKVYHLHKNLNNAFDFYGKALQLLPDMAPAAFGAAQIYFIKQDYPNALKLFTDLLQGNQDDKDTLAYVKLLKSILNEEITPFEKLREITPGFQYEIDLWLIQGQLRHKKVSSSLNVAELTESLKCYIYAKECYENQGMKLPLNILNNISNLYYLIGNHDKALDYLKLLFEQYHEENANAPVTPLPEGIDFTSLYNHADFENVYYTWNLKKPVTTVVQDPNDSNKFLLSQQDSNQNDNFTINLQELLQIGDEIMIENMIWIVESIPSPSEFTAKTVYNSTYVYSTNLNKLREMKQMFAKEKEKDKSFKAPSLSEMIEILSNEPNPLSIYIKEKWNSFNDQTLTYTYNLARILEDGGQIQSSRTLYQLIVAVHPSHADCYVRLSKISKGLGKLPEAIEYLIKAKAVSPDSIDIRLTLADLYVSSEKLEEAKKLYEDTYLANRKDVQALLAMGNYWYNTYSLKKLDDCLKMAYKFYFPVLSEHVRNAYAANGLGIVCANKNEMDAAREIFSKIRQANIKNTEDTDINLANVYMSEKRYVEAERVYYSVVKNLPQNISFQHYHYTHFLNLIGVAQYNTTKYEESFKTLLKAWHMTPMESNVLFNFSIISNQIANMCIDKQKKTSDEVDIIMNIVKVSIKILHYLAETKKAIGTSEKTFEKRELMLKENTAKERLNILSQQFKHISAFEEELLARRKKIDEEHQLRRQQKLEEKQQELQKTEVDKKKLEEKSVENQRRLEELRSKWIASGGSSSTGAAGDDYDDGDEDGGAKKKRKRTPNTLEPTEKKKRTKKSNKKARKEKEDNNNDDDDEDEEDEEGGDDDLDDLFGSTNDNTQPMEDSDVDAPTASKSKGLKKNKREEKDNDDDNNDWLDELENTPSAPTSTGNKSRLNDDSDDDLFGDKDEKTSEQQTQPMNVESTSSKKIVEDDDDDFNFD